jgi:hypothetical protein
VFLVRKLQGERVVLNLAGVDQRDELPQRDAGSVEIKHDAFLCL